jgi:hypothetical protein
MPSQANHGFGGNFNFNQTYRFTTKFAIGSYFGFWKDPITLQTTYPFGTWYNVALNQKFLKDKLLVSLRAVNFLEKTRDYKTITRSTNFTTTDIVKQLRRGIALAISWNFGKLTENVSKKKGVNNDDLLTRPATQQTNN